MKNELQQLCELDQQIFAKFDKSEIIPEEIHELVDNREQLLQNILQLLEQFPEVKRSSEWFEAINRTKNLVALMQSETGRVGKMLHKYRHGNKSVQQYKRFL
ncbi:flagellar protein FliT [Vibrio sp. T187]|uniref:flagellar protein FliT n=1 Tax=Vibrio TaxID=662 RepID=UPI0010C9E5AD|nr:MULTISPECIES: flagellar protein FliT [Vibrio]MBW3696362.1 flagellar protein FliT [Vibrio sp. T187]